MTAVDVATPLERRGRARVLSSFELWPYWIFYAPVALFWFYLAARYRGLTLPVIANTAANLSGFLGESKSGGLELLGPRGRSHLPPYGVFTTAAPGSPDNIARAADAIRQAGLSYPLVGKPDVGQNGAGVKIIRDRDGLAAWLASFRGGTKLIVQKYIEDEVEAGVFYVRYPDQPRGRVVSLTLKYLPRVIGDGASTLRELILADLRGRHVAPVYFVRHSGRLDRVVPQGEQVRLVSVGNHCRGAIFKNGEAHITPQLEEVFDAVAREMPGFYFGRFDVRFKTLGHLERGEGFSILEINGADAEMTHIWDAEETLFGAYRTLYRQYRAAFEIAAMNRARGTPAVSAAGFIAGWWRSRSLLRSYSGEE